MRYHSSSATNAAALPLPGRRCSSMNVSSVSSLSKLSVGRAAAAAAAAGAVIASRTTRSVSSTLCEAQALERTVTGQVLIYRERNEHAFLEQPCGAAERQLMQECWVKCSLHCTSQGLSLICTMRNIDWQ